MMKWKRRGQIFDFEKSPFAKRYISHSQSPQAVVFDDFVRIYFSTREQSENGKFLSQIEYIDMNRDLTEILAYSEQPVVELGVLGAFDEHGIFPFSPFRQGNEIWAYTTGWTRRCAVSVDTGIGLVVSQDDGKSFQRLGSGPVVTSSLHEPFLVCDGFIQKYKEQFHMWYIYGTDWKDYGTDQPERTYVIAHATSDDGKEWKKEGRPIIEQKFENECQALPTVIQLGERYHMYFCYRHSENFRSEQGKGYQLGYAWTEDLVHWQRNDEAGGMELSESGWDSEMMCYPHIFLVAGKVFLLYNGNEFGKHGFGVAELINDEK